jgi:YVTN family beta-propeller protein
VLTPANQTFSIGHSAWDIVPSRDGIYLYVSGYMDNVVTVIKVNGAPVTTIPVGNGAEGMAMAPNGLLYVCNVSSGTVSVIDTSKNSVATTMPVGQNPIRVAMSPEGTHAYVSNYLSGSITVIQVQDPTVTATVPVGDYPTGIGVSPDGAYVYVVSGNVDGKLSVFDTDRFQLQGSTPLNGGDPADLAITPGGLWTLVSMSDHVAFIENGDWVLVDTVAVPAYAGRIVIHPDSAYAYVASSAANTVSEIDLTTRKVTATASTPTPNYMAISTFANQLYVTNEDPKTVTVFDVEPTGGTITAG